MNLMIIIARYSPYIGGAEKQAERVATALSAKGHNVTVLTRKDDYTPCREQQAGVKICRLPFLPWGVLAPISFMFCCLLYILLRGRKTDLLYAHQPDSIFGGAVASLLTGLPLIAHFHGELPMSDKGEPVVGRGLKGKLMLWLMNRQITRCIAVSRLMADELQRAGLTCPVTLLPNGVDVREFHPAPAGEKIQLRRRLGLPEEGVVAVFAGRWERVKGLDVLLAAWKRVHLSPASRCLLLVLGTGSMADQVYSRGARVRNCILLGPVENVTDYLRAADILVMPSRYEGTSLAILEAMACGMAVLVTAVGGNLELISHEQNGILVPSEQVEQLTGWLSRLIGDSELRGRLGAEARARVEDAYSLDVFIRQLESLCLQAMGKEQTGSEG